MLESCMINLVLKKLIWTLKNTKEATIKWFLGYKILLFVRVRSIKILCYDNFLMLANKRSNLATKNLKKVKLSSKSILLIRKLMFFEKNPK